MNGRPVPRATPRLLGAMLALALAAFVAEAGAESCRLSSQQAGIAFAVDRLTEDWACRLKAIIDHYTTANRVGPLKTAMDRSLYLDLLDRPPLTAALINRLDLAAYKVEERAPGRWWAEDGEGTEGIIELVHADAGARIYYLEGTHRSRLLPELSGKAVVFLRMHAVKEANGYEAMETTMVAYAMLDNRLLSGIATLLRPLIGATISRKLAKGVEVVNRLGMEIRQRPGRILFEATDPPPFADRDVAFLKEALTSRGLVPNDGRSGKRP